MANEDGLHEVIPRLFLSDVAPALKHDVLKRHDITHVLNLTGGIMWLRFGLVH